MVLVEVVKLVVHEHGRFHRLRDHDVHGALHAATIRLTHRRAFLGGGEEFSLARGLVVVAARHLHHARVRHHTHDAERDEHDAHHEEYGGNLGDGAREGGGSLA